MSKRIVHAHIGDVIVSEEPVVISTVLGSCVSICLFDPETESGGLIHFALPSAEGRPDGKPHRYGTEAIPALIESMSEIAGGETHRLRAKIVGGARCLHQDKDSARIGVENIALARDFLKKAGIPVVGENVGGGNGRKVLFHTDTGRLLVAAIENKEIKPVHVPSFMRANPPPSAPVPAPARVSAPAKRTRVLVVDDSRTIRDLLRRLLGEDKSIEIIGEAASAEAARPLLRLRPDVITLDIHMPGIDGVEFLARYLPTNAVPTIMITSLSKEEGGMVFRALELGAVDYIQKPQLNDLPAFGQLLREKIKTASGARIRTRAAASPRIRPLSTARGVWDPGSVIALGASTGGTEALREVLTAMPAKIPPIVIVQHIPPVFSRAFAERLGQLCPFAVKEAEDGDTLIPDRVLVAPGGTQMKVVRDPKGGLRVRITDDAPVNRHKPSVDYLFFSVAELVGAKTVGAILTGMGADGAQGLLRLRRAGARTLSQDEATSVVYGMPKAAMELGASEQAFPLEQVAAALMAALPAKKSA